MKIIILTILIFPFGIPSQVRKKSTLQKPGYISYFFTLFQALPQNEYRSFMDFVERSLNSLKEVINYLDPEQKGIFRLK